MKALHFAAAMEQAIAGNLQQLRGGCSADLTEVMERLITSQQAFLQLLAQATSAENTAGDAAIDVVGMIGSDADWTELTAKFQPGMDPLATDVAVLWSVHAMLDKISQFYLQAAQQVESPQQRIFFSNLAEIKQKLRRRVGAVERIQANQVWKEIGFPPGLLGKE